MKSSIRENGFRSQPDKRGFENVHSVYLWMEIYQGVEWLRLFRPRDFLPPIRAPVPFAVSLFLFRRSRIIGVSALPADIFGPVWTVSHWVPKGWESFSFLLFFFLREEKRRLSFKNSIPNFLCVKWNILGNIWPRDDCVAFTRDEIQFKGTERRLPEKFEDVESKFLNETTKKIRSERNNTRIP